MAGPSFIHKRCIRHPALSFVAATILVSSGAVAPGLVLLSRACPEPQNDSAVLRGFSESWLLACTTAA